MNKEWPDFLVIGAGKCGTTSLDHYLRQHPGIYMSPVKEPNFYGLVSLDVDEFATTPEQVKFYNSCVTEEQEYLRLFEEAGINQLKGEISNTYLYHSQACAEIKSRIPEAKLVAIFRQPAERLYSRYLHLARENRLPTRDFSDCLDTSTIWWQRDDLVKEGFYFKHLSKFYENFSSDQIKVFLFEDLKRDPQALMRELLEFLGADSSFEPDMSVNYNSSGFVKNKLYDSVFGQIGIVRKAAGAMIPNSLFKKLKNSQGAQKALNKVREKNLHKPKFDPDLKRSITDIYKEDIVKLSELIGRDLKHWLY